MNSVRKDIIKSGESYFRFIRELAGTQDKSRYPCATVSVCTMTSSTLSSNWNLYVEDPSFTIKE